MELISTSLTVEDIYAAVATVFVAKGHVGTTDVNDVDIKKGGYMMNWQNQERGRRHNCCCCCCCCCCCYNRRYWWWQRWWMWQQGTLAENVDPEELAEFMEEMGAFEKNRYF